MARRASKKTAKKTGRRGPSAAPPADFHKQTVLFRWALSQFGVRDLKEFRERFDIGPTTGERSAGPEAAQPTNESIFLQLLINGLRGTTGDTIAVDRLREYDQNILEHTQAINGSRVQHGQPRIDWKYHQYLGLLFTEIFLDRYFADPAGLRDEINRFIAEHNERVGGAAEPEAVAPFPTSPTADDDADPKRQLARLAFWCATGSGKTLLMHVHVRQFRQYHQRAYDAKTWPKLDQIILVTPNDGLSDQHEKEFIQSGFDVVSVGEQGIDGLFAEQAKRAIKILSIHKFREDHGQSTVATESFAGCNLVLVDEGHRGAGSGGEGAWLSRRNQLAEDGFTFEYSATFKEAIGRNDDEMRNRYARSILLDYSYQSFYRDGYGKDFTILNLEQDGDQLQRRYLTAALLLFYQQMRVWMDGGEAIKPFQIDKPLWVFVGHTVTGGKVSTKDDKESVSDVVEVLLFLKQLLATPDVSVSTIQSLLEEGFLDQHGRDLLAYRLPHLDVEDDKAVLARRLHEGILRDIFNAPGGGTLTVQLLKDAAGELAVRVGEGEPFAVVNVGEPGAVAGRCEEKGITKLEDDVNRASLFKGINRDDSTINMLIGSRKFTEGWNSWRVSSIGLMRMGKGEGTQIVQLFGRGVRLRGYRMSLRRSSVLTEKPKPPKNLREVETLQVFGIKASYIKEFNDWIMSEVPEALERRVWPLPVVKTLPERRLKTVRLREEIDGVRVESGQAFRKLGPLVRLRPPGDAAEDRWLRDHPTRLNWLPRIRGIRGEDRSVSSDVGERSELPQQTLKRIPRLFFDVDALLFGLEAFKATRGLDRLHVDRQAIHALLDSDEWYRLWAAADDMRLDRYENRTQWQRMAQQLLNSYAERFYRFVRGRWEAPYMEVVEVTEDDPSVLDGPMTVETTELVQSVDEIEQIGGFVDDLRRAIDQDKISDFSKWNGRWRGVHFAGHLYQPLLYVGKNAKIRVSPVPLNKWEADFVDRLAEWCDSNPAREIFLLRNQAVRGLGFFQAGNFYPDFLLWDCTDGRHRLAFVDPKGLRYFDRFDPKIQFATRDIPTLQRVVDRQASDLSLSAFILCNTPFSDLEWSDEEGNRLPKPELEKLGLLFQVDDATTYVGTLMDRIGSVNAGASA